MPGPRLTPDSAERPTSAWGERLPPVDLAAQAPDPIEMVPFEAVDREVSAEPVIRDFILVRFVGDHLSRRRNEILSLRYGLTPDGEHSFEEIAAMFGLTKQRVQQLEEAALQRLRSAILHSGDRQHRERVRRAFWAQNARDQERRRRRDHGT